MTDSKHVERGSKGRARSCVVSGFPKHEGGEAIPNRAARSAPLMQTTKLKRKTRGSLSPQGGRERENGKLAS